jgi:hypothetical protein
VQETQLDDEKVEGTDIILMVGGFSESPMLRNAVERAFPNRTLIIPEEAGLAVFYCHSGLVRVYWYVYLFPELLIYSNSLVYLHVFVKTILA